MNFILFKHLFEKPETIVTKDNDTLQELINS